ncbi:hypothetical protein BRC2024_ULFKEANI_CDS_0197 [Acinetobacter phage vB_AbaM_Konradin-v2]
MKILVEVVATNMESGHIAVHQETIDIVIVSKEQETLYLEKLANSDFLTPKKVGPILISRSITVL